MAFIHRKDDSFYEALQTGLSISQAIELTGLDRSTYYRWMQKGKDIRFPVHKRFRNTVMKIQATLEAEKLQIIYRAAQGNHETNKFKIKFSPDGNIELIKTTKTELPDWHAAAWFLERRFPAEYRRKKYCHNLCKNKDTIAKAAMLLLCQCESHQSRSVELHIFLPILKESLLQYEAM